MWHHALVAKDTCTEHGSALSHMFSTITTNEPAMMPCGQLYTIPLLYTIHTAPHTKHTASVCYTVCFDSAEPPHCVDSCKHPTDSCSTWCEPCMASESKLSCQNHNMHVDSSSACMGQARFSGRRSLVHDTST